MIMDLYILLGSRRALLVTSRLDSSTSLQFGFLKRRKAGSLAAPMDKSVYLEVANP